MRKLLGWIVMGALMWGNVSAWAAPARGPVAQVTGVKGTVMMQNGGKGSWKAVRIFRNIAPGDRLRVPQGGLVTLFFYGDTHRENISGELLVGVNHTGSDVPANQRHKVVLTSTPVKLQVAGAALQELNGEFGGIMVRDPLPRPLGLTTRVVEKSTGATVRWQPAPGAALYRVSIAEGFGEPPLREDMVTQPAWTVPLELKTGRTYVLRLKAEDQDGRMLAESVEPVDTMSDARLAELEAARQEYLKERKAHPHDVAPFVLLAARLASEHLVLEAIDVLDELARLHPDSAYPHTSMATLYGQLGLREQRSAALKRAAALQK